MSWLSYYYIFLQSNALEIPFYLTAYREVMRTRSQAEKRSLLDMVLLVTLSNMITHPIVFFVIMSQKIPFLWGILIAESFAIIGEAFLHAKVFKMDLRYTLTSSTIANLVSWQIGPMITYWFFY